MKGERLAYSQPLLQPLLNRASVIRNPDGPYPREGWAYVTSDGNIHVHAQRVAEPEEWLYVLAHCVLHLGFGHFQKRFQQREWDLACECVIWQFLATLKLGKAPEALRGLPELGSPELPGRTEEALFRHFCENGIPADLPSYSLTGTPFTDMTKVKYAGTRYRCWMSNGRWMSNGCSMSNGRSMSIDCIALSCRTKERPADVGIYHHGTREPPPGQPCPDPNEYIPKLRHPQPGLGSSRYATRLDWAAWRESVGVEPTNARKERSTVLKTVPTTR